MEGETGEGGGGTGEGTEERKERECNPGLGLKRRAEKGGWETGRKEGGQG